MPAKPAAWEPPRLVILDLLRLHKVVRLVKIRGWITHPGSDWRSTRSQLPLITASTSAGA
jgi:hypothetical protein